MVKLNPQSVIHTDQSVTFVSIEMTRSDGSKHRVEFVPAYDFEIKMEYYDDPYLLREYDLYSAVVPRLGFGKLSLKTKLKEYTVITDHQRVGSVPIEEKYPAPC